MSFEGKAIWRTPTPSSRRFLLVPHKETVSEGIRKDERPQLLKALIASIAPTQQETNNY